jgi:hypothetical protein
MSNSKSKTHEKGNPHVDRGTVWVVWLVLLGLHGIGAIFLANTSFNAEYAQNRSLVVTALVVAAFLQVVSVIGMWFWKTWGLYLYITVTFIQMAAHMVLTASVWVGFYDAIPLLITGYILNYKKLLKNFS